MPTTVTGVASPSDPGTQPSASCPADTETGNAASVNGAFQTILNAIGWLRQHAMAWTSQAVDVSLQTGWSTAHGLKYWKDQFGRVTIQGAATGDGNAHPTIGLLPSGFRTAAGTNLQFVGITAANPAVMVPIYIDEYGNLSVTDGVSGTRTISISITYVPTA